MLFSHGNESALLPIKLKFICNSTSIVILSNVTRFHHATAQRNKHGYSTFARIDSTSAGSTMTRSPVDLYDPPQRLCSFEIISCVLTYETLHR